jgi:hypothetical protein
MEGRIDDVCQNKSVVEEDLAWLAAEVKDLKASRKAQEEQAQIGNVASAPAKQDSAVAVQMGGAEALEFDPNAGDDADRSRSNSQANVNTTVSGVMRGPTPVSWRNSRSQRITDLHYEFKDTVWDALVIVGTNIMHPSDELIVLIAGICNMIVQALFIIIVNAKLTGGDGPGSDDFVSDMRNWRVQYAHSPAYANVFSSKPLAYGVCEQDKTLMEGIFQANTYADVWDYLDKVLFFTCGDLLCMLSILLWMLTCFRELGHATRMVQGIWCTVYHSGKQELSVVARMLSAKSGVVIKSADNIIDSHGLMTSKSLFFRCSTVRGFVITVLVFLPRLGTLTILWFVGIKYLAATIQLEELILNAVALEVILHVDEMLYDIFVPASSKMILTKTHPMPRPNWGPVTGRIQPFLKVALMAILLVIVRVLALGPIIDNLDEVKRVMCDGETEFIAGELKTGIIFAGKPTRQSDGAIDTDAYKYKAILQKTRLKENALSTPIYLDSDLQFPLFPVPDVQVADEYLTLSRTDVANADVSQPYYVDCLPDLFWQLGAPAEGANAQMAIFKAMESQYTNHTIPNASMLCSVLIAPGHMSPTGEYSPMGYCLTLGRLGELTRLFCPISCWLFSPNSGVAFAGPSYGVTRHCSIFIAVLMTWGAQYLGDAFGLINYPGNVKALPCEDRPPNDPAFTNYAYSYVNAMSPSIDFWSNSSMAGPEKIRIRNAIMTGCPGATDLTQMQVFFSGANYVQYFSWMCDPKLTADVGLPLRTLRFLCPVSCEYLTITTGKGCAGSIRTQYKKDGQMWGTNLGTESECYQSCFNYTV